MSVSIMHDGKLVTLNDAEAALMFPATAAQAPSVPVAISRRQFFQQLAVAQLITQDEALAALTGTIPAAMETIVTSLPATQQFAVRMLLAGAQEFARDNAFVGVFQAAEQMTDAQLDALWTSAASL